MLSQRLWRHVTFSWVTDKGRTSASTSSSREVMYCETELLIKFLRKLGSLRRVLWEAFESPCVLVVTKHAVSVINGDTKSNPKLTILNQSETFGTPWYFTLASTESCYTEQQDILIVCNAIDLPLTCHPSPSLTTFAFRSSEVRRLLLDLDPYGGTDSLGLFPLFLKKTADDMAPVLV